MQPATYDLSIEEVAFALSLSGHPDVAGGYLLSLMGPREQAEIDGRLYAAAHSLMARGLLVVDVGSGEQRLDPTLRACAVAMAEGEWSLRCSVAAGGSERVLTWFWQDGEIVSHEVRDDVVSHISVVCDAHDLVRRCCDFLGVPLGPAMSDQAPAWTAVDGALVEALAGVPAPEDVDDIVSRLVQRGMSERDARNLAEDAVRPKAHGSLTRIQTADGEPIADGSLLLLLGPERYWVLRPSSAPNWFEACLGTPRLVGDEVGRLIH